MHTYNPIKYSPTRLNAAYKPYKELKEAVVPRKYLVKDEGLFGFDNIITQRANTLVTKSPIIYNLNKLYEDKLSHIFPNSLKPKSTDISKIIVRCFEASMHKDSSWGTKLFLSVVLRAANSGHCVFAMPPDIKHNDNAKPSKIILKAGDIFLLDPLAIHSVHSTSQKKEELILLQYELEFESREKAVQAMTRSKYIYQDVQWN